MQGAVNAFKTGAVGMFMGYAWNIVEMKAAREQGLDWGCVLPPKAPNRQSLFLHAPGMLGSRQSLQGAQCLLAVHPRLHHQRNGRLHQPLTPASRC